jgi:UDP-N-acetylmuramoyl-tripeptide--D-alanyl-D-alanine ligase
MIALRTSEIAVCTGGRLRCEATVTGVAVDSREVTAGDLFVALRGERTDGSRFAAAARTAGAAAVLAAPAAGIGADVEVDDPLLALGRIAALVRSRSAAAVVAITGSTGKTSTKDILAALLAPKLVTVASRANHNTEIGLPLTLCRIEPDTRAVVCEMGMRGTGQIAYLTAIARPDVAVITGIGPVHLEQVGSIEGVAAAKAEIVDGLAEGGVAVVPHGEALLAPHLEGAGLRVVTFGEEAGADVRLAAFAPGRAELAVHGRTVQLAVNFTQTYNARNLAAAVAAYDALGLPLDGLAEGAAAIAFSPMRSEERALAGGGVLMVDCYNANPVSMRAALEHLAVTGTGRRVAVLGDMAELGAAAPGYHRDVAELVNRLGIEVVIGVGELARGYGGTWFATAAEAAAAVPAMLLPGDAVLVKGSRSVGLEAVVAAVDGA